MIHVGELLELSDTRLPLPVLEVGECRKAKTCLLGNDVQRQLQALANFL